MKERERERDPLCNRSPFLARGRGETETLFFFLFSFFFFLFSVVVYLYPFEKREKASERTSENESENESEREREWFTPPLRVVSSPPFFSRLSLFLFLLFLPLSFLFPLNKLKLLNYKLPH